MRPRLLLLPIVSLLTFSACSSDALNAPDGPIDVSLVLAPGETKGVVNTNVALRLGGVLNDSRCPGEAICITGGAAMVQVRVIVAKGRDGGHQLHPGTPRPARHNNLT